MARQRKLRLACELAADRVMAAHGDNGTVDLSAVRTLGAGAVLPNLTSGNILMHDVVRTAVREALAPVAGRGREIVTVVPDGACRVVLLDFDTFPAKQEDADAVVRFRLKKSLPFDVERARVSYHPQAAVGGKINVLAAVLLNSVLEEYEAVVREAGYSPGLVLPSILAALGQVDGGVPTLVIKVDPVTTSVAIVDRDQVLLVRTLENAAGAPIDGAQLAEDVYPSLVFFQDTYGTKVQRVLVGGTAPLGTLTESLEHHTGLRVQDLVSASSLTGTGTERHALAGVVGALIA